MEAELTPRGLITTSVGPARRSGIPTAPLRPDVVVREAEDSLLRRPADAVTLPPRIVGTGAQVAIEQAAPELPKRRVRRAARRNDAPMRPEANVPVGRRRRPTVATRERHRRRLRRPPGRRTSPGCERRYDAQAHALRRPVKRGWEMEVGGGMGGQTGGGWVRVAACSGALQPPLPRAPFATNAVAPGAHPRC